ncbi:XRE family transcriptional regulator [bacterium (Candidatus Gribaldobacteria) CG07_land_8_20_14_0_80_33_18]|uniref:XRE family transcriptional regulator n=1 Tax=bacterium (Candidatus Gribaldobacteria) CG07_land_8_20_14_0_80_33_18 TaxID=2014272 RepID=A0A2M6Z3E4_9BACT|nr:MAG: XRE family transcriptional regulator [bacterium (Candidatus Gribaldobacteria) CG10_big_fil_rev_8_21_14_0_10_33_41]PIU46931.1 MAG: XRE family transcriptional regulator [bacterium (Candidatus Gribaldobacteria) CG07_land_8_20_14_0_80_33_18]PJA01001.1 MAG: XRE family transcriptional regulator [bacterium (Candidatus Gribaldobacteria) CG_4_10_14_0_2_um_filter_33_15]
MDIEQLSKFLVKAKINTYASSGEGGEKILFDESKEFEFEEKEFKYRDRYFGFDPFIGQEIVWQNGKIIWGMNYYGKVVSEVIPVKQIYQFLKEVLKKVLENKPFRGPDNFKQGDFEYFNKVEGVVENFQGEEAIFYKKQLVYKLNYHGGLVIRKNLF